MIFGDEPGEKLLPGEEPAEPAGCGDEDCDISVDDISILCSTCPSPMQSIHTEYRLGHVTYKLQQNANNNKQMSGMKQWEKSKNSSC